VSQEESARMGSGETATIKTATERPLVPSGSCCIEGRREFHRQRKGGGNGKPRDKLKT